jgi:ABC-2 type transport system permease protein
MSASSTFTSGPGPASGRLGTWLRHSPLLALSGARIKQFYREPGVLFWTFGFPLLITVALGIAFRAEGPARAEVVVVAAGGAAGTSAPGVQALVQALAADPGLDMMVLAADEAAERLRRGQALVVVEPPAGPGQPVVYRFDPSRPEALAARRLADDRVQRGAGRADRVAVRDETAVARGARYVDWLVPGLLGMQLLSGGLWGTAWNIVNARQRQLLKRLAATPMRRRHFLLSFRVAGLLLVPLQVVVLLVFARVFFGVTVHGSHLAVMALSLLGSWSFAGLGLLCASRAQNAETANGLINLVTLPMFVVSGVFFSSSRFPEVLHPFIRLLPLSAFNDALRALVNDGATLASQWSPLLVLVAWGVLSSALALRLFKWT